MERTHELTFIVQEESNSSSFSTHSQNHLWFKLIDSDTQQGMKFRIPFRAHQYDDSDIYGKIQSLEKGMVVEAILERKSNSHPWKPVQLKIKH